MSWAKLDDGFHAHPKLLKVGLEGTGLQARAISYCADYETNGRVPKEWVDSQTRNHDLVRLMVDAGLWDEGGSEYVVHDYLAYNPSKDELAERRRKDSGRKPRGA